MTYLLEFFISLLVIFGYYFFFVIRRSKKFSEDYLPTEVSLLIKVSRVDVKKIGYKRLAWHISIVNSIGIATILVLTNVIDKFWLKMVFAAGLTVIYLVLSNYVLRMIYKKKGWAKKNV